MISIQDDADWVYAEGYGLETDKGVMTITTDKPGRAVTAAAIPVVFSNGDLAWCFDRRIVAMVADNWMRHEDDDELPFPKKGEEIHLPTQDEADEIF